MVHPCQLVIYAREDNRRQRQLHERLSDRVLVLSARPFALFLFLFLFSFFFFLVFLSPPPCRYEPGVDRAMPATSMPEIYTRIGSHGPGYLKANRVRGAIERWRGTFYLELVDVFAALEH